MKNAPAQGYIFALALLLYCSPLPYVFGEQYQRFVLPVYVAMQFLFVMACYKLVREKWIIFVILIEAFCMTWNAILFFRWQTAGDLFYSAYSYTMFLAFVLEILIINLSMRGGEDERRNADGNPKRHIRALFCRINHQFGLFGRKEVAK